MEERTHIEMIHELKDKIKELEEELYGKEHPKKVGILDKFDALWDDYKFIKRVNKALLWILSAVLVGGIGFIWWLLERFIEVRMGI